MVNVRFANEDVRHLKEVSEKLATPYSTLVRQATREWLKYQMELQPTSFKSANDGL